VTTYYMRIGVPCSLNATEFTYEAPPGWRIAHVHRLACGWFSIILEWEDKENPPLIRAAGIRGRAYLV